MHGMFGSRCMLHVVAEMKSLNVQSFSSNLGQMQINNRFIITLTSIFTAVNLKGYFKAMIYFVAVTRISAFFHSFPELVSNFQNDNRHYYKRLLRLDADKKQKTTIDNRYFTV